MYGVSFECYRVQVDTQSSLGYEAAARQARFAVFERLLQPGEILLLGQHLDDQIETLLYRLVRGSGPRGLSGIPGRRKLGQGYLLRPMLAVPRSTITRWATENALPFIEDPSNADTRMDRNYLRHTVLPLLEQRWPNYRDTVGRAVSLQRAAANILESQPLQTITGPFGEPGLALLEGESEQELSHRLYHWLIACGYCSPGLRRLSEYARQCLTADVERSPELGLPGARLSRWRKGIYRLEDDGSEFTPPKHIVVGQALATASGTLTWERGGMGLPEGVELQVRTRLPGEKVALIDGPTRSFKHLCQAAGLPPWWRNRLLVLCQDETPVAITGLGLLRGATTLLADRNSAGFSPCWRPNWCFDSIE